MNSNIIDVYSLTPAQEGIYAQYFQSSDTKSYQIQNVCQISKETDLDMIKKSIELLSLRHRVLKTAFTVLKSTGAIKQVILENRKPEFRIIDLSFPFSQDALQQIVDENLKKSIDLQKDSLFRVTVIDFTDVRLMLMHAHHIILDGWCLPVLLKDLQKYYGAIAEGISIETLEKTINEEVLTQASYAQYANWIKKQDKNKASEYWKNLLADCSLAHIFGKEKKDNTKNEDSVTFETPLRTDLSKAIESFAKKNKVSPNTVFECAFSIAMQRYAGSEDILFDKVISGRGIPLKNIENTVGPFINTVPVRLRCDGNCTLSDLLKESQKQTVNTNTHGILPLAEVYKICNIDSKSVDALFVFENYFTGDISAMEKGPLSPQPISFYEQTEFNLTVTILKGNDGYIVRTTYAKQMYSANEIASFIKGYISILGSSLDASKRIRDIAILGTEDKQKLLFDFNNTAYQYNIPQNTTLYSLFEKTATENNEKICIRTAENAVTFGKLRSFAEQIDCHIRTFTGNRKSVIAVIADRSIEMYAAVYGIIRGGNAYLPLDPAYPQERIDYILNNSKAAAVVAQGQYVHLAGDHPCIDMTAFVNSQKQTDDIPSCAAQENDTAYVIYTSGSTGNPKGAKISHKSAVNRILWMHDKYPLGKEDVILQKTPYTFDVSVWELFWWGLCGGCLAASKPGEHFLPAKILDETNKNNVTHLHFVPSVFELFLQYLETNKEEIYKFDSVRYVFLSGEALTANLTQRFYALFDYSRVSLHNLYGPTECAVDVTYYDCVPTDTDPIPIGKPIYNTQMYVTDKYMNPVPVGVTGELCIAGTNVGQGYLNNPALTSEKFIDNPFGEGKLYRTGDLAFWREDGNIVFVGRMDGQIKLHGQRIEIAEIESVISSVDGVDSVAVAVRQEYAKDLLVAFYTGTPEKEMQIKESCYVKLPAYMVPSVIVHLDRMPLNQSGKLDRKLLLQTSIQTDSAPANEKPVNETERHICEIFERFLGVKDIGRHSDFFEMGGTSLSLISVLSEKELAPVSAAEFMRNPTPAKLSLLLQNKKKPAFSYLEPLYVPSDAKKSLILIPFAGGGAQAFGNFVSEWKKRSPDTAVYFIGYLHTANECKQAAAEIAKYLGNTEISLYSHCVGSAVALPILQMLEDTGVRIHRYFAAASIPPAKPKEKNVWNKVSDRSLQRILVKAGAQFHALSEKQTTQILKQFRKDTDFANFAFTHLHGKVKTPTHLILSKKDVFTGNYKQAEALWDRYAENIQDVCFIDSASHYFQTDNCETLIDIILKLQ